MSTNYEGLELSTQLIVKAAIKRGINVEILDRDDNFIRLKKDGKTEYIKQASRTSADNYIAPLIMENKEVTKIVLDENGIRVPKGISVKSVEEALNEFNTFKGNAIVVKPKSTNYGQGVIILKDTFNLEDFRRAVEEALHWDNFVLIEEFAAGKEYRFLVIGDKVSAVLHRVPANVTGDGVHNIEELVKEKNQDPLRGEPYTKPLFKINLGSVEKEYLRLQGKTLDYVPKEGEIVYIRKNSNLSTGGDSIDFTDDVIEEYKEIAIKASKAVGARICGADIIIQDIKAKPTEDNYSIIELNFNPGIHMHSLPYKGKNRNVEEDILDLLGF